MPFPDICLEDRETCPNEWPTLFYAQNACSTQEVQLRDRHGEHYDLRNRRVRLIAKEGIDANLIRIAKEAVIKDAANGIIEIPLNEAETTQPGLFVGEFIIERLPETSSAESSDTEYVSSELSSEDEPAASSSEESVEVLETSSSEESLLEEVSSSEETSSLEEIPSESSSFDSTSLEPVIEDLCDLEAKLRCYVEIQEDLWHTDRRYHTLTIAEVRLGIRDKCREDNFLLDRVEFTDTEIAWALRRPVDYWNETLPPLHQMFTTMDFPFVYHWFTGVVGELLAMAAVHTERNELRYSAAGLNIDDKHQGAFYQNLSDRYKAEYRDWVREKKRSINMSNAFGRTSLRSFDNYGGYGSR